MIRNIWDVLGIEATTDKKEIKKAYAKKTKQYHPEDNPKEFQVIQEAYQMAINYANNTRVKNNNINIENNNYQLEKELDKTENVLNKKSFVHIESEKNNLKTDPVVEKKIDLLNEFESLNSELGEETGNNKKEVINDISIPEEEKSSEKNKKIIEDIKVPEEKTSESEEEDDDDGYSDSIFNKIEYEIRSEDELNHMKYFLDYVERKVPQKINLEIFKRILSNSYIKSYIQNYDFKEKLEAILIKKSYEDTLYTEKKMAEIARKYNLIRLAREIERNIKKRYIGGIRTPIFILWIMLVSVPVGIFISTDGNRNNSNITKNITEKIEITDEKVHKMKESILKTNLIINQNAINGYNIEIDDDGYYIIKNAEGDIVQRKVNLIEFTTSPIIILNKSKAYYILNTDNGTVIKTKYKKVKSVDVFENNKKRIELVGLDKVKKWYIIDNQANKLKEIKGTKDSNIFDVIIENGEARFLND